MPRGTTQVVTRDASNNCVSDCTGGRWRLDQSDGDTWHWHVSVRGTVAVSTRLKSRWISSGMAGFVVLKMVRLSSQDPEEDPEEWDDVDAAEQVDEIPHPVTPPRNPTAVPHSSPEQSSESEDNDLANSDEAQDVSPPKST
ncbi:hypothetical protein Tco_0838370 [Tanacetum coccineum]|uniref:Uncharacterized protein n=1 Tax=Tanacetum coccineum TaxID=301880 RepID=A0ABQ5ANH3_9ASTR